MTTPEATDRNNPIAELLDLTIPSVQGDPKRPLIGFYDFAKHSAEFERFQRQQLANMLENSSETTSTKMYTAIAQAVWYGFEAGKNYVIAGGVERMLSLEDDCYRARMEAMAQTTAAANEALQDQAK